MRTWSLTSHIIVLIVVFLLTLSPLLIFRGATDVIVILPILGIIFLALLFNIQFGIVTSLIRKKAIEQHKVRSGKIVLAYIPTAVSLLFVVALEAVIIMVALRIYSAIVDKSYAIKAGNKFKISGFTGKYRCNESVKSVSGIISSNLDLTFSITVRDAGSYEIRAYAEQSNDKYEFSDGSRRKTANNFTANETKVFNTSLVGKDVKSCDGAPIYAKVMLNGQKQFYVYKDKVEGVFFEHPELGKNSTKYIEYLSLYDFPVIYDNSLVVNLK